MLSEMNYCLFDQKYFDENFAPRTSQLVSFQLAKFAIQSPFPQDELLKFHLDDAKKKEQLCCSLA